MAPQRVVNPPPASGSLSPPETIMEEAKRQGALARKCHELEAKNSVLQEKLDRLLQQNEQMQTNQDVQGEQDAEGRDADADDERDERKKSIKEAGIRTAQIFVIQFCLWTVSDDFNTGAAVDDNEPQDAIHRFGSSHGLLQGQLRDLVACIAEKYDASFRRTSLFNRLFLSQMGDQRSQMIKRVRREAAAEIFGPEITRWLKDPSLRKEHLRKLLGWTRGDDSSVGRYSPLDAPLIHECSIAPYGFDLQTAFLGEIPMKVYAAITRGTTAVQYIEKGHATGAKGSYLSKILSLQNVYPGSIAGACTLACFALSEDTNFVRNDGPTGIDWLEWQNQYLRVLIDGLEKEREPILRVFKTWDMVFYPGTADRGLGARLLEQNKDHGVMLGDGMERALAQVGDAGRVGDDNNGRQLATDSNDGDTKLRRAVIQSSRRGQLSGAEDDGSGDGKGSDDEEQDQDEDRNAPHRNQRGKKRGEGAVRDDDSESESREQPPSKATRSHKDH
ncbi:hypothetical protein CONPUDRAFT_143513 [Coniophora puteana RWD-64-598 SS2]|uniref:Uncharacterized protein n=1 Tax=Coniophora puteana (strain RWD-64-598) TaxID=741705 RepID=A0A5M3MUW7_CONPW|nr:uncharacterized protein CONPUDRAFT_143513 [Coniophora puteana RWD-64-598 SS2]EIW82544.1 hypothetical protein CONPUDRAFT_143513 [Coniophora puteana RWD-64-598 SS2]